MKLIVTKEQIEISWIYIIENRETQVTKSEFFLSHGGGHLVKSSNISSVIKFGLDWLVGTALSSDFEPSPSFFFINTKSENKVKSFINI